MCLIYLHTSRVEAPQRHGLVFVHSCILRAWYSELKLVGSQNQFVHEGIKAIHTQKKKGCILSPVSNNTDNKMPSLQNREVVDKTEHNLGFKNHFIFNPLNSD